MPLNPVDTAPAGAPPGLGRLPECSTRRTSSSTGGGFILSRGVTHASERESKAVPQLIEKLPLKPVSLAADTGYSEGSLRQLLEERNITAYIPIHPRQETSMVSTGDFAYHGDHLVCPQGKILRRGSFHRRSRTFQYVARQKDCQACPIKETCLPSKQKRRYFTLTMYHPLYLRARDRNRAAAYRRERRRRQTIVEGTFASLDRLVPIPVAGIVESRLRGIHGRSGPQRAEAGSQVEPRHRPSRAGAGGCGCHIEHREVPGRCRAGRLTTSRFLRPKLVGPRPQHYFRLGSCRPPTFSTSPTLVNDRTGCLGRC